MAFNAAEEAFDSLPSVMFAVQNGRRTVARTLGWVKEKGALATQ